MPCWTSSRWAISRRVDALKGPWALHDAAASRAAEAQALSTQAEPGALMEAAGLAVARLASALAPHAGRVWVWAGPGNNGGDGLVAARLLHGAGRPVTVVLLADPARLPGDATLALARARAAGVPLLTEHPGDDNGRGGDAGGELAIDALLGLGARRPPDGALARAIATLNKGAAPILAVDLPSGLHPDTGQPLGEQCVIASATLSLLSLKPGLFTARGRDHAGQVWLDTLGVHACPPTAWLSGPPAASPRLHASHKGSHGDVVVVGGAPGMAGAAWLAARAALAAGAGRVYCSLLDPDASLLDAAQLALMGRREAWLSSPAVLGHTTVVCGCGGGSGIGATLPPLLSHAGRLVLDADALNAIGTDAQLLGLLQARARRGLPTLLTPHPLEAARLLACNALQVQADRLAAAAALHQLTGCAVLLKGSGTVITGQGTLPCIIPTGNAALATAGTGDVLAGWVAGLWAQAPSQAAQTAAASAAWLHGHAADEHASAARPGPLLAPALIDAMARLALP